MKKNRYLKCPFGLLLWAGVVAASVMQVRADSIKKINKEIKSHRGHLEQLQNQIDSLEAEKSKLKQDEASIIRSLKRIESDIEQSKKKQNLLKKQIRETESRIKGTAQGIRLYTAEGNKLEDYILDKIRSYYMDAVYPRRLKTHPVEEWEQKSLIGLKYADMKNVSTRKNVAVQEENHLLDIRKNLQVLKLELEEEILRQRKAVLEKKKIYETTQGRRMIAEQEARKLRETSRSLEEMIARLTEKKERTLAAQMEAEKLRKSFHEKKGRYPWPVIGQVVSSYGRQKHPDLGIIVINNGIQIKTAPNSPVNSIEKGQVIYAADFRSYGQTVIVDHGGDTYSVYGLLGNVAVKEGEKVTAGEMLGSSGSEDDSRVYFEFRNQGRSENPLQWLQ